MLIGKNLTLRPVTLADQKMLVDWYNDPDFMGAYDNHWTSSLEELEREHQEDLHKKNGAHMYLITRRDNGEPLGEIGFFNRLNDPDFQGQEIGYAMHPAHRGRGIASQAACILVNHLFDATPLNRIQATVIVGNEASCRVLEHAGMTREGILRGFMFLHGLFVDMHMYSILRSEWCDEAAYRRGRIEF